MLSGRGAARLATARSPCSRFGDSKMRSLVVLIAVIVGPAAFSVPASAHEWYTGLRSPDGMSCCNERDCRPLAYRIKPAHGTGGDQRERRLAPGRVRQSIAVLLARWWFACLLGRGGGKADFSLYYTSWHGIHRPLGGCKSLLTTLFTSRKAVGGRQRQELARGCCS